MKPNRPQIEAAATAIANARGNRRGVPVISNVLDLLGQEQKFKLMDEAEEALLTLGDATDEHVLQRERIEAAATAIAQTRAFGRKDTPKYKLADVVPHCINLDTLPPHLKKEVLEDAEAVLRTLLPKTVG